MNCMNEMNELYFNENWTLVFLIVDCEHVSRDVTDRCIAFLTARSPVFNAMFEHEMEESKKVCI